MWNRDLQLKSLLITLTGVAAFALLIRHGMRFDFRSAAVSAGTVGLLLPFAIVFNGRKLVQFSNLLTGFVCMVAFNLFLTILTYAGTPLNAPLADSVLMSWDKAMGIHLPAIVAWVRQYPTIEWIFYRAYFSVLPSTLLALIVLGLDPDVRRLREFVLHYILGGLICTVLYFMLPAVCPFGAYGYEGRPEQTRFLEHFLALRAGEFHVVSLTNLEGLITFPSFHTTWAILLAYSFRHYRWLFPPMAILNLAVVISTMTTGWHYGADVVGGILTAMVAIYITRSSRQWLHQDLAAARASNVLLTAS